ncbi:MAG: sulfatase-like hydrolase/transferase [Gemmatimonadales bacterium]
MTQGPPHGMMDRFKLLYPFFFAILPILNVVARHPGGSSLADAAVLAGVALIACAALYGLLALVSAGRLPPLAVPLVLLAGIIWFYGFDALRSGYRLSRREPGMAVLVAVAVVAIAGATAAGTWWLARRPRYLDRASTFFALTGALLVVWLGGRILIDQIRLGSDLRSSELVQELARPLPASGSEAGLAAAAGQPRRDVYVLVLDEYPNSSVLRERFGFDNRQFEDSLRQLGFTIPQVHRSNYALTLLSLPSFLNFSHLTRLSEELGADAASPSVPHYLVEKNRTAAFLKARGYRFLFFPSQWWISTRHNRNADWEFEAWTGFDLDREATRSDLRRVLTSSTPLQLLGRSFAHDADHVKRTLAAMARVPRSGGPTFAFAHIINPHWPYVFEADCGVSPRRAIGLWNELRRDAFLDQVRCLNHLLLEMVTTVLRRSAPSPIIVIVGDHGTSSLLYSKAKSAEAISPAQARERFGAFGAFYLPAGGGRLWADSVTLVNVMPKVLNFYFDAGIPLAPDSLYISLEGKPYRFVPADPGWLSTGM